MRTFSADPILFILPRAAAITPYPRLLNLRLSAYGYGKIKLTPCEDMTLSLGARLIVLSVTRLIPTFARTSLQDLFSFIFNNRKALCGFINSLSHFFAGFEVRAIFG